ncbi:class I SAM-dependent methyltransferase [Dactylosporangium matsuzakiense]|uniref:SAM-dependent methyltransferase n=1 Tax=Dactylosporangium matsuzakiense TaxID=53360 RepID=A0A9W6KVF4_9ACTN|nr:class I SAM-dependent methyltransferase [Dactylosporangium matsuzakiense]UWZ49160.1 class I SAM-dependent methyltransferase [Dactylosporangium matsuzakiense]GLL08393.1 SAM-dependent methyltransferase [Dactylosporangium matsuzakiense]
MSADYWNGPGATKTFTHPLRLEWLPAGARVFDYGCGYGRTMAALADAGFSDVAGADISAALLERGRALRPDLTFTLIREPPYVPVETGSVDVVLLFAVLTCVPGREDQRALVAEAGRVLRPGGLLYVSDLLRHGDPARYDADGVFTTSDGAVCRHHDRPYLLGLLQDFDPVREEELTVTTMNGNEARGVQLLVRKR